jgi:hypothetical protein
MKRTITAELWPFAIQHAATIYNTTKRRSRDYDICLWEQFTGERSKLDQTDTKGLRRTPSSLFKIRTNGMGPEDKTGLATISCHV